MTEPLGGRDKRGGTYAIHDEIAAGGMATVHLGRLVGARGFARTVAIKVLHASYATKKSFVARFVDEARVVARIHHPNVMPTLDVIAEGDDLRIVMEYVAGESLAGLLARTKSRGERVPARIACAIIVGVLHGLHAAHEAKNEFGEPLGIVHLDVSPQNILVGVDGTTRVLDFGIARARGERADPEVSGKPAYLAPEQVRGTEVSPRTDVFAASIVLWEMLAGEPLFAGDNHAATMQRVLGAVIPPVSDKAADIPARLDEALRTGLKRDPSQRFATARDMALELEQALLPALPSEVGTWVEGLAREALQDRAKKVRDMEASSVMPTKPGAMPGLVAARDLYEEEAAVNLPGSDEGTSGSLMHVPENEPLVPERAQDGSIRWKARSIRPPPPPGATPKSRPTASTTKGPTGSPAVSSRRRGKSNTLWVAVGGSVAAIAVFAVLARLLALPGYVRGTVVSEALAHGVVLTVSDAELSDEGVLLRGVTARLVGVPQATATIVSADVRVAWGAPVHVLLGKTDVTVDGDAQATLTAWDAWRATQHSRTSATDAELGGRIEVPAARLVWTHVGGDVTRVEARSLSGTIASDTATAPWGDTHMLTPALVIETRHGTFGPWNLDVDTGTKGSRARVAFDPAVPDGANALLVLDAAGDTSFDVTIPRVATASLGVPRSLLGEGKPLPQQTELALHYGRSGRDKAAATLRAGLYGAHVPELGTSVDLHASAEASGSGGGPLTVKNGTFSIGPIRGTATGTVTPGDRSASVNVAWKADPIPCASLVGLPNPVLLAAGAVAGILGGIADGGFGGGLVLAGAGGLLLAESPVLILGVAVVGVAVIAMAVAHSGRGGGSSTAGGSSSGSSQKDRATNPSKSESSVWQSAEPYKGGLRRSGNEIWDWDNLHNDIEVYNVRGQHLGSRNPTTGEMYKPAVSGRWIKL